MMAPLPYPDLRSAVLGLHDEWNTRCTVDLHVLPYNRFEVKHPNLVWLAPTRSRVAFKFGKILLGEDHLVDQPGHIFCGLHIEKGPVDGAEKRDHQLGSDWIWHEFIAAMDDGLARQIARANTIMESPLELHLVVWSPVPSGKPDHVLFEAEGERLTVRTDSTPLGVLKGLKEATSLSDLATRLQTVAEERAKFFWVGLQLGQAFRLGGTEREAVERCVVMLRCFEPWLRAGTP